VKRRQIFATSYVCSVIIRSTNFVNEFIGGLGYGSSWNGIGIVAMREGASEGEGEVKGGETRGGSEGNCAAHAYPGRERGKSIPHPPLVGPLTPSPLVYPPPFPVKRMSLLAVAYGPTAYPEQRRAITSLI